jgi:hypothetical protein
MLFILGFQLALDDLFGFVIGDVLVDDFPLPP